MWNLTLPLILTFQKKLKALLTTLVHIFPLKNLENLTFRRHCSSPGKSCFTLQNAIICTIFGQNAKYEITSISVFRFCKN